MPSAWSVTVLNTVSHLSSFSSSLSTPLSSCTDFHSTTRASYFLRIAPCSAAAVDADDDDDDAAVEFDEDDGGEEDSGDSDSERASKSVEAAVGVGALRRIGSIASSMALIPLSTESSRSSRLMRAWSMLVVLAASPEEWDLCRSSWISVHVHVHVVKRREGEGLIKVNNMKNENEQL